MPVLQLRGKIRCSIANTRPASASASSPELTGTLACKTGGPPIKFPGDVMYRRARMTVAVVQRALVGYAGPGTAAVVRGVDIHQFVRQKRATNSGVRMRMKPASTIRSGRALSTNACQILIKSLSRRVALMVYQGGLNTGALSNGEPAGAGAIADHQRESVRPNDPSRLAVSKRLEI